MTTYEDCTRGAGFRFLEIEILPPNKLSLSLCLLASTDFFRLWCPLMLPSSVDTRLFDGLPGTDVDNDTGVAGPRCSLLPFSFSFVSELCDPVDLPNMRRRRERLSRACVDSVYVEAGISMILQEDDVRIR